MNYTNVIFAELAAILLLIGFRAPKIWQPTMIPKPMSPQWMLRALTTGRSQ